MTVSVLILVSVLGYLLAKAQKKQLQPVLVPVPARARVVGKTKP